MTPILMVAASAGAATSVKAAPRTARVVIFIFFVPPFDIGARLLQPLSKTCFRGRADVIVRAKTFSRLDNRIFLGNRTVNGRSDHEQEQRHENRGVG
jgi:hypothetical protein